MTRERIAVETPTLAGLTAKYTVITATGIDFINDERTVLHFKSSAESDAIITAITPVKYSGLNLEDLTVEIPAGGEVFIGPFPKRDFSKDVSINTDTPDEISVAAIRIF